MCCVRLPRQQLVRKLLHGIGDRFDRQHELARKFLDISVEALLELQYTTPPLIGIIKDAVDAVEVVARQPVFHAEMQHRVMLNQRGGVEGLVLLDATGEQVDDLARMLHE